MSEIDDFLSGGSSASSTTSDIDDFLGIAPKKRKPVEPAGPDRTLGDIAGDVGVVALKGAVGLPQAIVGLADIPTGGRVGKALEDVGYRPGDAQKAAAEWFSDPQKRANQAVHQADGFIDTAKAAIENPSAIAATVGESIPQMLGGAGVARGLLKAAPAVAPWLAGAVGEGVMGAGSAAEQLRGETKDGLLTAAQSAAALASGVGTAALGAFGGRLAQRLGLGDIDTMLASGVVSKSPVGFAKQIIGSGISEGVFEELPQSIQEQMWQNYALDKPLTDGVGNAAALGLLSGAAMGGAGGGYNAAVGAMDRPAAAPVDPAAGPAEAGAATVPAAAAVQAPDNAAEQALLKPTSLTALDRVQQIDVEAGRLGERLAELSRPESGYGPMFDQERQDLAAQHEQLLAESADLKKGWPAAVPGAPTSLSTEAGTRIDGAYALMNADDLVSSHDVNLRQSANYPQELQPRDRDRAASEMQVSGIVQRIDPARLGASADAATGAPIVGADGLVESGNARTIALKRIYQANGQKADDYRQFLRSNAAQFGLAPEAVDSLAKPVLVRIRSTPVDRAEFARQANAPTVAQMSPSEQAKSDAQRIDSMEDLAPDDNGDFSGPASRDFVRRFMSRLPNTEQAGMIDASGALSSSGYQRVRNAVLAKAYGDSPMLLRMVESMDDNLRNVSKALTIAAPRVAQMREAVAQGSRHDADLTPDLMTSVEELSRLKDSGTSVSDALAQLDMLGEKYSPETREILQFLSDNARRPRRMADFIVAYNEALDAAGDPNQGSLLDDGAPPAKAELMTAARRAIDGESTNDTQRRDAGEDPQPGQEAGGEPEAAPDDRGPDQVAGPATAAPEGGTGQEVGKDWQAFAPELGTLGIPREDMPQIKAEHRGALVQFLKARGIEHQQEEVPPDSLKPTQAEFSPEKVKKAQDFEGGDRSILVSQDNHVVDGHHQWLARGANGEAVKVIRLNAPIAQLLDQVREFPSAEASAGANDGRLVAQEPEPGSNKAPGETERADYTSPYDTDLFGDPIPDQSGARRASRSARPAVRGDGQPAAAIPGDTGTPRGTYRVRTIVGSQGQRDLGASRVRTPEEAAKATAYLYKSAVERFDGIVTDAAGVPLAVIGGFKGAIAQTSVYPATLIAEAVRIKGAARVWFSHNHPSGGASLSKADLGLYESLEETFKGSGIEPAGLLAVAGKRFDYVGPAAFDSKQVPEPDAKLTLPVIEREQVQEGQRGVPITSPDAAKVAARESYNVASEPGLLLVDSQNAPVAWVPIDPKMLGKLRGTGGLNAIYRGISESNAAAAFVVHAGELDGTEGLPEGTYAQNIAGAVKLAGVRPLDIINVKADTSAAERGETIDSATVFSRGASQQGMPVEAVQQLVDEISAGWANAPEVVVVQNMQDEAVPARVREVDAEHKSQGATGEPEGFFYQGKVYMVASELPAAADAARVMFHEALGHYGLRGVYGDALKPILSQLAVARPDLMKPKAKQYGLDLADPAQRLQVAEEVLAELAQTKPEMGFVKRAVAAVRTWLREHVPGFKGLKLTDAEIIKNYILPARGFVERGRDADADGGVSFARAFHGTPHRGIDKFSTDKIGSGEGAQAYGWGLYFASKKEIAEHYRKGLSYREIVRQFRDALPDDADLDEALEAAQNGELSKPMADVVKALAADDWLGFDYPAQAITAAFKNMDDYDPSPALVEAVRDYGGQLYEVDIPDDSEMLLWDKPIADQSAKVRVAMEKFRQQVQSPVAEAGLAQMKPEDAAKHQGNANNWPGKVWYLRYARALGGEQAASESLAGLGIKGIKYLDGGSRAAGDGSHNYVVFDGDHVQIIDTMYSRAADAGSGAAFSRANDVTETPEFKRWFGDSKVVDAKGKPLVVYHGSPDARFLKEDGIFATMKERMLRWGATPESKKRAADERGFFFTSSLSTARTYANPKRAFDYQNSEEAVIPAFVSLQNPMVVEAGGKHWREVQQGISKDDFIVAAKKAGHDGVIIKNVRDNYDSLDTGKDPASDVVVAFSSNQIKHATDNSGTFDRNNPDIRFSRGESAKTAAERADDILQAKVTRAAPLDKVARAVTKFTGIEKATRALYDRAAFLLDRYTPETIKAGVVSDYGVPESVIDQRAMLQGRQRVQLRQAGSLIEKLSTLTRAESRVAYAWMNETDTQEAEALMKQLPEASVKVLQDVQQMVDRLSREAVQMGQLSPEAYERNKFAYLRRSYAKHVVEQPAGAKAQRSRTISILGDQYKGRGLTEAAPMKQIQNGAPDWWKRKLQEGKADTSLKGEQFIRLERHAASGEGTQALDGMEGKQRGRLEEVHYFPAGEPMPAKYADWDQAGTWEVRDVKGGDAIMWRDFTKAERETMGEVDEARFAIAKTLHGMIHDVEVGRYLEWLAHNYAMKAESAVPGQVVEASERYKDTFKPGEWVKVPDTKIPGTDVAKYGKLAGRYLQGPIWNDLRQVVNGQFKPFGDTFAKAMSLWKTAKTALSPAVHMNNVMSNMVMADWHDVGAAHTAKALRLILAAHKRDGKGVIGRTGNALARAGIADREAALEVLNRYKDSGGDIGGWATNEIASEQLEPLLASLEAELAASAGDSVQAQVGVMAALQHAVMLRFPSAWDAFKGTKAGKALTTEANNLIEVYQSEDDVFRLAAWLKAKEDGATDLAAGKLSRQSFLDYRVNAPWIQAMRNSAWPFISFTYRAVPMLLETAAKKPHKLMKLMALAGVLNALGVAMGGGGDDDERKLLPEEKAGRIWGMVPKMIRMPWNDSNGSPVYLDIRRFIPVGDVLDVGQGHSAVPMLPGLQPGGPLVMAGELVLNRSAFTGKPITLDTDTAPQQAAKVADYLYKAFAPNVLGLPGTYATQGVIDAAKGRTDAFGREQSVAQAVSSAFGLKLGSYPADVLRRNLHAKAQAEATEIDRNIAQLKRQRQTNRLTQDQFQEAVRVEQEKKVKLLRELSEKLSQ